MKTKIQVALLVLLGGAAIVRLTGLGIYMFDVDRVRFAMDAARPVEHDGESPDPFFVKHNCLTSYTIATYYATQRADNIYDPAHYRGAEIESPTHVAVGDALTIDRFQYPPPFLLLPRLLAEISGDFFVIRAIWYGLNVAGIGLALVLVALWCGGGKLSWALAICPVVLLAPTTLMSLQFGNVHLLIIALAMLSMLAFARGWHALGGVILAYATLSKIFPGVLLAYLLVRRKWRSAIWCGVAMIGLGALTLYVFGAKPLDAFLSFQLPRIANGEAFDFATRMMKPLAVNLSVYGVPYKLEKLGVFGAFSPAKVATIFSWILTGSLVLILAGHRVQTNREQAGRVNPSSRFREAAVWLALLVLAQQRSPFLPWTYGTFATLWLIALLIMQGRGWWLRIVPLAAIGGMLAVNIPPPLGPDTDEFKLRYTLIGWSLILMVSLGVLILRLGLRAPAVAVVEEPSEPSVPVPVKPTASAQMQAFAGSPAGTVSTGDHDQPADPTTDEVDPA
ncbi:MAG: glycosyltransferase family 87 protein [Phycisphaerae bacterium]